MAHTETMLESREIFNGRVIRVTVDKVQQGQRPPQRKSSSGACILWTPSGQRDDGTSGSATPSARRSGELPAGKLEADEDPFEAAKRELSEEIRRNRRRQAIDLGVVYARRWAATAKMHLWAATGLQPCTTPRRGRVP